MTIRLRGIAFAGLRLPPAGIVYVLVSLWGCLAIYAATRHNDPDAHFALRQVVWMVIGVAVLMVVSGRRPSFYRNTLCWWIVATGIPLVAVLFLGIRVNGMRGWFAWHGVFLQPSEFAKPVFAMSLGAIMEKTASRRRQWLRGYLPCLFCAVAWVLPIAAQPDFGTILVYILMFAVVYWVMGGPLRHLVATGAGTIPLIALVCWQHPYVANRLAAYISPDAWAHSSGWHMIQFRRTLASGGLFGRSLSSGRWSDAYLPLGYSDSIFATAAETMGFVGVLPIVILIVALVAYGHYRVCRLPSPFTSATVLGIVAGLAGQAFIHLSVNLGLLPPTGLTLPMISYGGSSLVSTFLALGIIEALVVEDVTPAPPTDPTS